MVCDSARQALRGLLQEVRRARPQQRKESRPAVVIDQRAEHPEETGCALDLVQDDQLFTLACQVQLGIRKLVEVRARFQVQIDRTPRSREMALASVVFPTRWAPRGPTAGNWASSLSMTGLWTRLTMVGIVKDTFVFERILQAA